RLVRTEIDDTVRDDEIDALIRCGERLSEALAVFHLRETGEGDALPTLFQHGWRHVDGDDPPGGAHGPGSQEGVEAAACTDIQNDLPRTGCAERERSAHAGKGPRDRVGQVYQVQSRVPEVVDRVSWSGMEVITLLRIADDFAVNGLDRLAEASGINWHRWSSF